MKKNRKELISHHTFMLPFKWTPKERDGFISNNEFNEVVDHYLGTDKWASESFTLDRVVDYNEFHYFYDYVREALYDYKEGDSSEEDKVFIRHLSYKNIEGGKYFIEAPIPKSKRDPSHPHNDGADDPNFRKIYELEIDSVLLHLYYTGVGVLSFHLNNRRPDQADPEDILHINQYGRRVFPPFYRVSHWKAGHQSGFDSKEFNGMGRPHGGEIAYSIAIQLPGEDRRIVERWQDDPAKMVRDEKTMTFRLARFLEPFLGELFAYRSDLTVEQIINHKKKTVHSKLLPGDYKIQSVLDDRMFVVCWYGNQEIINRLEPKKEVRHQMRNGRIRKKILKATEAQKLEAIQTDDWLYKFIFIDSSQVTVQNPAMRRQLLDEATYLRWSGFGTYYGITDYSFVLLTAELPELRLPWNNASFLVTHLQTIYFRLCELVLIQRASVQRFSDEVTHVSRIEVPDQEEDNFNDKVKRLSDDANELYKRYIRFINRVYFREVTAQAQGIELYQKLQQQARLPTMVESLKEEIHELHNYVRQETERGLLEASKHTQQAEKKRADLLTLLGAVFLAPGLLVSVYDLGFLGDCLQQNQLVFYPVTILAAMLSAVLFYYAFPTRIIPKAKSPQEESDQRKETRNRRIIASVLYVVLLLLPLGYGWCMNCNDMMGNATDPIETIDETRIAPVNPGVYPDSAVLKDLPTGDPPSSPIDSLH